MLSNLHCGSKVFNNDRKEVLKMIGQYIYVALTVYLLGAIISLSVAFLIKAIYMGIKLQGTLKLKSAQLKMLKAS